MSKARVVSIHYTLTDDSGEVLDSSRGGEPLSYLEGAGNIIPGLERELLAAKAGDSYGKRIAPVWVNVSRAYYNTAKGADKEAMEQAHRLTQAGKWEEAAEIWHDLLSSARDSKTKGKAAHNLALALERNGNLKEAEDWASKAYTQYGNKTSQAYVYTLQQRISDQERLDYQLKKVKP